MASLAFLLFWLAVPDTGERSKAVEVDTDKSEARNAPALDLGHLASIETRPSQRRVKELASREGKPQSHSLERVATALILLGVVIALGIYAACVTGSKRCARKLGATKSLNVMGFLCLE
jgi:hypothetical protein